MASLSDDSAQLTREYLKLLCQIAAFFTTTFKYGIEKIAETIEMRNKFNDERAEYIRQIRDLQDQARAKGVDLDGSLFQVPFTFDNNIAFRNEMEEIFQDVYKKQAPIDLLGVEPCSCQSGIISINPKYNEEIEIISQVAMLKRDFKLQDVPSKAYEAYCISLNNKEIRDGIPEDARIFKTFNPDGSIKMHEIILSDENMYEHLKNTVGGKFPFGHEYNVYDGKTLIAEDLISDDLTKAEMLALTTYHGPNHNNIVQDLEHDQYIKDNIKDLSKDDFYIVGKDPNIAVKVSGKEVQVFERDEYGKFNESSSRMFSFTDASSDILLKEVMDKMDGVVMITPKEFENFKEGKEIHPIDDGHMPPEHDADFKKHKVFEENLSNNIFRQASKEIETTNPNLSAAAKHNLVLKEYAKIMDTLANNKEIDPKSPYKEFIEKQRESAKNKGIDLSNYKNVAEKAKEYANVKDDRGRDQDER